MLLFSDTLNGSVQSVDITWVVMNLIEHNRPIGEI